jgi:hypothetical protein
MTSIPPLNVTPRGVGLAELVKPRLFIEFTPKPARAHCRVNLLDLHPLAAMARLALPGFRD